jgi:GxxExxY protein
MKENELATIIVDSFYTVHKELGPGLLESTYEACLLFELENRGIEVSSQKGLQVSYKGYNIDCGYRCDNPA